MITKRCLPSDDIRPAFDVLKDKSNTDATYAYFAYIERTWLTSDVWTVDNWSVYGRSIRTHNDCEGWHNRLNRTARKGNLPFYLLTTLLFQEARDVQLQCKLVKEKKLRRFQTKQTGQIQGRLFALWEKYGRRDITTSQLLDACAALYGPV